MRTITDDKQITFDPQTETYRLTHDWQAGESIAMAVTIGVAAVTDTPPTEMNPLYEVIDPDALNQLYTPTTGDSPQHSGCWTRFTFNKCDVSVYEDGKIEITPQDEVTE